MFDNIKLKICPIPKNTVLFRRIDNLNHTSENTYQGNIKNMQISKTIDSIWIWGSLPKYLQGENIMPLNREKIKQGIKKLERDTDLDLKDAIVCFAEFGTSIITKRKPFEYLDLFAHPKLLTRNESSKWYGTETVFYNTNTGSFEFIGYDKINEMLSTKKKIHIPPIFLNSNVLRLEYKILKRRGIQAKFKRDLSAYDLFNEDIYETFKKLFLETYRDIDKMGRNVYFHKSEKLTPLKVIKLQAEQYRQSYPKEYQFFIQTAKEAGLIDKKNLQKIRAENRKYSRNVYISDQNDLIRELDAYIFDVMQYADV